MKNILTTTVVLAALLVGCGETSPTASDAGMRDGSAQDSARDLDASIPDTRTSDTNTVDGTAGDSGETRAFARVLHLSSGFGTLMVERGGTALWGSVGFETQSPSAGFTAIASGATNLRVSGLAAADAFNADLNILEAGRYYSASVIGTADPSSAHRPRVIVVPDDVSASTNLRIRTINASVQSITASNADGAITVTARNAARNVLASGLRYAHFTGDGTARDFGDDYVAVARPASFLAVAVDVDGNATADFCENLLIPGNAATVNLYVSSTEGPQSGTPSYSVTLQYTAVNGTAVGVSVDTLTVRLDSTCVADDAGVAVDAATNG